MQNRYKETKAKLQKIEKAGYKNLSILMCEFKKLLCEKPGLENEPCSQAYVKNFPINIRESLYEGTTVPTKTYYIVKEEDKIHYVDVINLYPYICKYGKSPLGHTNVYVGADCPPDCLDRKGIIRCKVLPYRKHYQLVLPYKSYSKLMFALCSAGVDTMEKGN